VNETPELGKIGVWIGGPPTSELARALDDLGFGAIWIGGSPGGDLKGVERTPGGEQPTDGGHGNCEHLEGRSSDHCRVLPPPG